MACPEISKGQVLIQVAATSVNFADIKSQNGKKVAGALPFIPGLDATGTIVKVGSDVQNFKSGDRVIAFPKNGSYAELSWRMKL